MLFFSFSSVSRLRLLSSLLHPKGKIKTPVSDCGECEHTYIWYMLKHKRASNEVEDEKQNRTERFKCERKDVEEVCGFISLLRWSWSRTCRWNGVEWMNRSSSCLFSLRLCIFHSFLYSTDRQSNDPPNKHQMISSLSRLWIQFRTIIQLIN